MKYLNDMVLKSLENDEPSRDSDIRLTNYIYVNYFQEKLIKIDDRWAVKLTSLYELPKEEDVRRLRAKIQNEEGKFLPTSEEVRIKRKISEERWRNYLGYK